MAKKIGPLQMRHWGDPVLRQPCHPVNAITPELRQLVLDMIETMYNANGVGLAAPQVGRNEALCVIDVPSDAEKEEYEEINASIPMPLVMFNPEILTKEGEQTDNEGCLSFPSIHADVTRANKVSFTFHDINGERQTYTAYGLLARAVQHELEHLGGGVFIDNVEDKTKILPKLEKLEKKTKKALGLL
ncbi:MAG: peptide deformylase [bacterium]|nr:peptide deformylase [bacterium]